MIFNIAMTTSLYVCISTMLGYTISKLIAFSIQQLIILVIFRELLQDYPHTTEIFKYMGSNRIGVKNYKFYIKWANFENDYNFNDRAKRVCFLILNLIIFRFYLPQYIQKLNLLRNCSPPCLLFHCLKKKIVYHHLKSWK